MFNRTTLLILLVALATGAGLMAAEHVFNRSPAPASAPPLKTVRLMSTPRVLPDFALQQSDRTQLLPGELRGHWTVVFIGFTFCPDVCPTTLAELAQAQKQWEALPEATRPRVLFVSVDPERDTPGKAGEYAHAFHADTLAATADVPALEKFATSVGFVFMKVPGKGFEQNPQDYSVDHSANIALLDPQGRLAGLIRPPFQPQAIADDLARLTAADRQP
jgi:protein SCO1/2